MRFILSSLLFFVVTITATAQTSETNARLKAALKRFPAADDNKDGVLTRAEVIAFLKSWAEDKERLPEALKAFPAADTDGNGELTQEEAGAFFRKLVSGRKRPNAKSQASAKETTVLEGSSKRVYKRIGDVELSLFIFKPMGHTKGAGVPAIVFFHGGGWRGGSPKQFEQQCLYLANRGMVAVTVQYRLTSSSVKVEDCIEDAKSAMRWVRGHAGELGIDPNRIASGGGSAGGHLGACVAVIDEFDAGSDDTSISAKPNAMVLFNPAMALAPNDSLSKTMNARLGQKSDRSRVSRERISPLEFAGAKQPPCIMFFGTADGLKEGADRYVEISVKAGNDCRMATYEGQGHGFFNLRGEGRNKYYDLTVAEMDKFFVKLGWLK